MSKPIDVSNFPAPGRVAPVADPTETPKPKRTRKAKKGRNPRIHGLPEPPDGIPYAHKIKPPKKHWNVYVSHDGNAYGPFHETGWDENEAAHDVNTKHEEFADTHTRYYCKLLKQDPDTQQWLEV